MIKEVWMYLFYLLSILIFSRFVQLQHGEIDKRVEVKPYVLDDQLCDECQVAGQYINRQNKKNLN